MSGTPGADNDLLAWLVLTNLQPTSQVVRVRIYPEGGTPIDKDVTLAPHQRYSLGFHSEIFGFTPTTFSVVATWPLRGLTQLVMRSSRSFWTFPPAMPAPQEWCVEEAIP